MEQKANLKKFEFFLHFSNSLLIEPKVTSTTADDQDV